MTVNEVIELGKIASDVDFQIFSPIAWWWYLIVLGLLIGVIIGIWANDDKMTSNMLGSFCVAVVITMFHLFIINDTKKEESIERWKSEVALPYITNLEIKKSEVLYLKIDPELSHSVNGSLFYTYSTPIQLTPLAISFKDNGVPTITQWVETRMELTDEELPYIEYQKLEQDLGHGINAGYYNIKLYLPESYKFTDIK